MAMLQQLLQQRLSTYSQLINGRSYVRSTGNMNALDYGADTDWQKELMRTAISHSHNINFSSSKKSHGYRASFTYNNNEGVIKRNI